MLSEVQRNELIENGFVENTSKYFVKYTEDFKCSDEVHLNYRVHYDYELQEVQYCYDVKGGTRTFSIPFSERESSFIKVPVRMLVSGEEVSMLVIKRDSPETTMVEVKSDRDVNNTIEKLIFGPRHQLKAYVDYKNRDVVSVYLFRPNKYELETIEDADEIYMKRIVSAENCEVMEDIYYETLPSVKPKTTKNVPVARVKYDNIKHTAVLTAGEVIINGTCEFNGEPRVDNITDLYFAPFDVHVDLDDLPEDDVLEVLKKCNVIIRFNFGMREDEAKKTVEVMKFNAIKDIIKNNDFQSMTLTCKDNSLKQGNIILGINLKENLSIYTRIPISRAKEMMIEFEDKATHYAEEVTEGLIPIQKEMFDSALNRDISNSKISISDTAQEMANVAKRENQKLQNEEIDTEKRQNIEER